MRLPRRSWPMLALAGLGVCVLAVRGCVSVARAAGEVEAIVGLSGWEAAAGGGGGGMLVLAMMLLREEIKNRREAPRQPVTAHSPHYLTRDEVERIVTTALHPLVSDMHGQHSRVRDSLRDRERDLIAIAERFRQHEVELADRLARMETTLAAAIASERSTDHDPAPAPRHQRPSRG